MRLSSLSKLWRFFPFHYILSFALFSAPEATAFTTRIIQHPDSDSRKNPHIHVHHTVHLQLTAFLSPTLPILSSAPFSNHAPRPQEFGAGNTTAAAAAKAGRGTYPAHPLWPQHQVNANQGRVHQLAESQSHPAQQRRLHNNCNFNFCFNCCFEQKVGSPQVFIAWPFCEC